MIFGFVIGACNPVKHIPEGKVFLKENKIQIPTAVIDQDVLYPYIRQKANKRALWVVKIKMQQYLSFNDSNLTVKNEKKRLKIDAKNERRLAAEKDTVAFKPVIGYRLKEAGEAPVVFDKRAAEETTNQFEKALFNRGYFHNKVNVNYEYNKDSTKVTAIYSAKEGKRFHLNKIALVIDDTSLLASIKEANKFSYLHKGDAYNTELIDKERLRFTSEMRNRGYFFFSKEYIAYEVDSTIPGNLVNLKIIVKNPTEKDPVTNESISIPHLKYTIGTITLNTSFNSNFADHLEDSIHFEDLIYVNLAQLKYNPHSFVNKLFFSTGDYYSQYNEERTYSRISGLNNFSYINMGFIPDAEDSTVLNCNLRMTPLPSQSVGIETEGTTSSGNLGVSGYLNYLHRNIFGNAEEFKIRLKGGFEAQQTNSEAPPSNDGLFSNVNTIEYGIETSLIFQDLILPPGISSKILKRFNRPKTSLNFVFNNQERPDFNRKLINVSLGYFFTRKKENINEFFIYPADISYIKMEKSVAFEARLEELNNPLLNSTYSDQFIVGSRAIETWTNRKSVEQKSFVLNRIQADLAGNLLFLFNNLVDSPKSDSGDFYQLGNIRYAQFIKAQNDWHFTRKINRNQSMAFRVLGGIGVPYGNAEALPYDRSFYGGGANDNRGWRARTLGPGALSNADSSKIGVDQVADIKIQFSAEYRFNLVKAIEGAVFADVGNIWLLNEDPNRPNANFEATRFLSEMALAVGPGVRLNFGFLLVRFDWGFKIYDPGKSSGERWIGQNNYYRDDSLQLSSFNLGIGYPF